MPIKILHGMFLEYRNSNDDDNTAYNIQMDSDHAMLFAMKS